MKRRGFLKRISVVSGAAVLAPLAEA
ncbi:MAG: twin-arginine translocation signal domain-containing protein [Planctomycetes bacterium]|nr:twin-arginine translocation signal domain-containing protein [Planctomycetota bacterium]